MSFCFDGPRGSLEQRWIVYALLRDNVQHHLEGGQATDAFQCLYRVADALGGTRVVLPARQLHAEMERAKAALLSRPIVDLAISSRTRAVIDCTWPPPSNQVTEVLGSDFGAAVAWLPAEIDRLDQVFGHLIRSLIEITEGAKVDDVVEVWEV
jgi:hypothetical protein